MDFLLTFFDWTAYSTGVIGAPLGWIEYFYPKTADSIEDAIDRGQDHFERWGDKITRHRFFEVIISLEVLLLGFVLYIPLSHIASPYASPISLEWYHWVLICLLYLPIVLGLASYFLAWMVDVCNKATGGHALGTIGLALIVLGIICDSADKIISFIIEEPAIVLAG